MAAASSGGVTPFGEIDSEKDEDASLGRGKARVNATMNAIGMGFAQLEVLFLAGGVFLTEGCLLVLASIVVRTLEVRWHNSMFETTLLATSMFLGVSVGCMAGGLSADTNGRRPAVLVCYCGSSVFVLLCAAGMHLSYLVIANVLLGFFFGFGIPPANALISESCPTSMRSMLVCSAAIMFALGQMCAGIIVWMVSPYLEYEQLNWRIMSAGGCIPILFLAPMSYLRLPESPMWLWVSGHHKECKATLRKLAVRNGVDLRELATVRQRADSAVHTDEDDEDRAIDGEHGWYDKVLVLFTPKHKFVTQLLMFVTFSSNFCYYGMIYVLPETFAELMMLIEEDPEGGDTAHLSPAMSLMLSALFEIPGVLLAIVLSYTTRRKMSLTISFSVLSIAAIALVSAAQHKKHAVVLASLAAFSGKLFIASAFILTYLYILEVYPTNVRSSGLAFCMTFGRLGAFLVPLCVELCMHLANTTYYFFAVLGVIGFCAASACLLLPAEGGDPLAETPRDIEDPLVSRRPSK